MRHPLHDGSGADLPDPVPRHPGPEPGHRRGPARHRPGHHGAGRLHRCPHHRGLGRPAGGDRAASSSLAAGTCRSRSGPGCGPTAPATSPPGHADHGHDHRGAGRARRRAGPAGAGRRPRARRRLSLPATRRTWPHRALVQQLGELLGVASNGNSLTSPPGQRIVFGASKGLRHTISADGETLTFGSTSDLLRQWVVAIVVDLERDWTWDGLAGRRLHRAAGRPDRHRGDQPAVGGRHHRAAGHRGGGQHQPDGGGPQPHPADLPRRHRPPRAGARLRLPRVAAPPVVRQPGAHTGRPAARPGRSRHRCSARRRCRPSPGPSWPPPRSTCGCPSPSHRPRCRPSLRSAWPMSPYVAGPGLRLHRATPAGPVDRADRADRQHAWATPSSPGSWPMGPTRCSTTPRRSSRRRSTIPRCPSTPNWSASSSRPTPTTGPASTP